MCSCQVINTVLQGFKGRNFCFCIKGVDGFVYKNFCRLYFYILSAVIRFYPGDVLHFSYLRSMMMPKTYWLTFLCLFALQMSFAQNPDSSGLVKYTPAYTFKNGIYLSYQDFKNNEPLPFSSTDLPSPSDVKPEKALDLAIRISYYNKYGMRQVISPKNLWGFCYNDKIYVQWSGGFHMVPYIGNISHFVAKVQVRYSNRADPFYDPYYVYSGPSSYVATETKQMLLNTGTGEIFEFTPERVLALIKDAPELYEAFSELNRRKQRKMKFYYIRLYNEKKDIYFPAD